MLQDRQVERTVLKVARLADMYSQFVVKAVIEPCVTIYKNGKTVQAVAFTALAYAIGVDMLMGFGLYRDSGLSGGDCLFPCRLFLTTACQRK